MHHRSFCSEESSRRCRATSTTPRTRKICLSSHTKHASSDCHSLGESLSINTHVCTQSSSPEASSDLGIFFVPRSEPHQVHYERASDKAASELIGSTSLKQSSATSADINGALKWEDDDVSLAKSELELLGHVDEARKLFGLRRQLLGQCLEGAVGQTDDLQRVPKLNLRSMNSGLAVQSVRGYSRRVAELPATEDRPCSQRSDMLSPIIAESGVHVRASSRSYLPNESGDGVPPRAMTPPADVWFKYRSQRVHSSAAMEQGKQSIEVSSKLPPMSAPCRRKKISGPTHPLTTRFEDRHATGKNYTTA